MVSGMVNSFIQMTFLIKIAAALVAYVIEDGWRLSAFSCPAVFDPLPGVKREA
jgi:hypothetical protein